MNNSMLFAPLSKICYFKSAPFSSNQLCISTGRWFSAINYMVHAIMYSYYTIRASGKRTPKFIPLFITTCQISQMVAGRYIIYKSISLLLFVLLILSFCQSGYKKLTFYWYTWAIELVQLYSIGDLEPFYAGLYINFYVLKMLNRGESCSVSTTNIFFSLLMYFSYLVLFANFFIKTYLWKPKDKVKVRLIFINGYLIAGRLLEGAGKQ